jgi:hypothetical protein
MAVEVKRSDKLAINLISVDDRVEVYINGAQSYTMNLGDPSQLNDLLVHFQKGRNVVRVHGIDTQPVKRAIKWEILLNGKQILEDQKSQDSTEPYPNHWYDVSFEFDLA